MTKIRYGVQQVDDIRLLVGYYADFLLAGGPYIIFDTVEKKRWMSHPGKPGFRECPFEILIGDMSHRAMNHGCQAFLEILGPHKHPRSLRAACPGRGQDMKILLTKSGFLRSL